MLGEPHPSLLSLSPLQSMKRLPPPLPASQALSFSPSTGHTAIATAASYPAHANVGACNLSSIKAMQREFMLACHRKKRRSGESFEQVDR